MIRFVNYRAAQECLSDLIERALAGELVVISQAGKPVIQLSPVAEEIEVKSLRIASTPASNTRFTAYEGEFSIAD